MDHTFGMTNFGKIRNCRVIYVNDLFAFFPRICSLKIFLKIKNNELGNQYVIPQPIIIRIKRIKHTFVRKAASYSRQRGNLIVSDHRPARRS